MRVRSMLLAAALALASAGATAWAVDPEDQLADPVLESRAREISKDLRCLVCAGQTIDDSSSPVAHALRKMVRERLSAGDSDQQVIDAVTARYGDYALLKPRFNAENLVLWLGPFAVLILGGVGALHYIRAGQRNVVGAAPLTDEERAALAKLDQQDA